MTAPDPVRAIAQAVLYEGYLLWPYRRSALKNQQRFSFGGVHPAAFATAQGDRSAVRMGCLLEAGRDAEVEVGVRWLQLVDRRPLRRAGGCWAAVDELVAGGDRHLAWQEATEHEATTGPRPLAALRDGVTVPIHVAPGEALEPLAPDAALRRAWEELEGTLAVVARPVGTGVWRLEASVANDSGWPGTDRPGALARSFLSAHVVGCVTGGAFLSETDPPAALAPEADACRNDGLWPVLAGEPGRRDLVLGAPIVLGDHPAVAPESPGDLFDGGEIDALLVHSIRALSDAERDEARATDPRVRELLDRSMGLTPAQMQRLYGAVREQRRPKEGR